MTILHEQTSLPGQCLPTLPPPLVTGNPASNAATATSPAQATDLQMYQEAVAGLLFKAGKPITQATMEVAGWRALDGLLTENVLIAAATDGRDWYKACFDAAGLTFATPPTPRPVKRLPRVLKKIEEAKQNKQDNPKRTDTEFKPHSDLCAFVVREKDTNKILPTAKRIVEAVVECGGGGYVRSRWEAGPDIVEYVFLYHEKAGFIAEVQVAHPFAAYTFHLDSRKRDVKNASGEQAAKRMLDLWDHRFYFEVKAQLLGTRDEVESMRDLYDRFVAHLQTASAGGGPSARPDDPCLPGVLTVLGLKPKT